jgi:hypothetical protein
MGKIKIGATGPIFIRDDKHRRGERERNDILIGERPSSDPECGKLQRDRGLSGGRCSPLGPLRANSITSTDRAPRCAGDCSPPFGDVRKVGRSGRCPPDTTSTSAANRDEKTAPEFGFRHSFVSAVREHTGLADG